jgi:HEAT repeat protein
VLAFAAMFGSRQLPRSLPAALRDLGSPKAKVRVEAVRDLARHEGRDRAEVLRGLEGALLDPASEVRAAAATALADVEGREALPALLSAIADEAAEVRQMVVSAVGELAEVGDTRAIAELQRALSDERPEVRFQAVIAFPRLAASREAATLALLKASHDDDTYVCHIALRIAEELAEEDGGQVEEQIIARARALLLHGPPMVRVASAILLARPVHAGSPSSHTRAVREVLIAVALRELSTSDRQDEATAIELCGEFGLQAACPGLERRAFGGVVLRRDRFAWNARVALARMGHERACREIAADLDAWDRDRRTLAVAAAGRARLTAVRDQIAAMRGDAARADPHAVDEALAVLTKVEA